jgi:hypothetical protein
MKSFWGGYNVEFKVIERSTHEEFKEDIDGLRRRALPVGKVKKRGASPSSRFNIQLSKHEFCARKESHILEGYTIYVYTPIAFVCEKVRAICQQMPEYVEVVHSHPSARARDFVDICVAVEKLGVDFESDEFAALLGNVFAAKHVPMRLIGQIQRYRGFHRPDFASVRDTVKPNVALREFDYYFDYVVERCKRLEALWDE